MTAEEIGAELIPADDPAIPASRAIEAAAASALENAFATPTPPPPIEPFGREPLFDWERGRFVRNGSAPAWATGLKALEQWVQMTLNSTRFAHAVFTNRFGVSGLEPTGDVDATELVSDLRVRLRDALLVHNRITGLENYAARYLVDDGVVWIDRFDVVTDEDQRVRFGGIGIDTVVDV